MVTLRAQRLKKFKIALRDWNFQSRLKISCEPPSISYFCGEFSRSGLKFSIEIENFKRDWKFQARLIFFNLWALVGSVIERQDRGKNCPAAILTLRQPDVSLDPLGCLETFRFRTSAGNGCPKAPAVLKTVRDSELLRRSVFTTPPQFYYAVNPSLMGQMPAIPRKLVSAHGAPR